MHDLTKGNGLIEELSNGGSESGNSKLHTCSTKIIKIIEHGHTLKTAPQTAHPSELRAPPDLQKKFIIPNQLLRAKWQG